MFRNLILLIVIGIVVWLLSRMLKNKARSTGSQPAKKNEIKSIVQCHVCQVFIPEDKAIKQNQLSFCSQKHLEQWQDNAD